LAVLRSNILKRIVAHCQSRRVSGLKDPRDG
jgi:hypothetical protein